MSLLLAGVTHIIVGSLTTLTSLICYHVSHALITQPSCRQTRTNSCRTHTTCTEL